LDSLAAAAAAAAAGRARQAGECVPDVDDTVLVLVQVAEVLRGDVHSWFLAAAKLLKSKNCSFKKEKKRKRAKEQKREREKEAFPFPVGVFSLAPALAPQQTSRHGQCRGTPTNGGASKT
jgi:hypothetical protein